MAEPFTGTRTVVVGVVDKSGKRPNEVSAEEKFLPARTLVADFKFKNGRLVDVSPERCGESLE